MESLENGEKSPHSQLERSGNPFLFVIIRQSKLFIREKSHTTVEKWAKAGLGALRTIKTDLQITPGHASEMPATPPDSLYQA